MATKAFFEQALAFARKYDLLLCHGTAYMQVTVDGFQAPSVLEVDGTKDVTVEFNTLSKSHNMAGSQEPRLGIKLHLRHFTD